MDERRRDNYRQYIDAVRERVKFASDIIPRPSDELRQEERIIIFRRLISQLMGAEPEDPPHIVMELIRTNFDVDKMLYFVAPDWWEPKKFNPNSISKPKLSQTNSNTITTSPTGISIPMVKLTPAIPGLNARDTLTMNDQMGWTKADERRPFNYSITEDSEPAKMGSSIGWLLQLDGDTHRNLFLNCSGVKAVIPIRPGREKEAIDWLKTANIEGADISISTVI